LFREELQELQSFIQQEITTRDKTDPDSPDTGVVSQRLDAVSALWDRLAAQLGEREASLTEVLAASTQFHDTVKTLVEWLTHAADSVYEFSVGLQWTAEWTAEQHEQFKVFV